MVTFNHTDPSLVESVTSDQLEAEFDARFGTTQPGKNLGYEVVGRLSRWEGGNSNPYQQGQLEPSNNPNADDAKPEKISLCDFVKQFFRPTYDLTEVTIEDIKRVKLMHDRFMGDAQFNFNYSTLLVIASVIAGVGLGSDSAATVIASMLVSPLMGPVTATAYGISIGDFKMVRMAMFTELVSLCVCILMGLMIAACMINFPLGEEWPTAEMSNRATWSNFFCGIPIAFFSGLGVAVGLLDSETNSLVGVAISASLLPPAVNAGMLWVLNRDEETQDRADGTISLFLTLMNIAVIIVASMFMFRLKETLPIEKNIFWTDLGVARKIYHNVAILPKIQEAPDNNEIRRRVTKFFPRASAMVIRMDRIDNSDSSNSSSGRSSSLKNKNIARDSSLGYSSEGGDDTREETGVGASFSAMPPIEEMK
uniref:TIGR00341 family protein n=1 Tax=Pseudo-nitzschia australis TaxID=44445 RepID=A0A7S4EMT1_9STRA|mmetsp:Transcript_2462/g.5372  ORF Transcript_2462/g.5372 Transcript_2462/m.5372 type:complete len:423 (+) Transcript_2462:42-1310(+)